MPRVATLSGATRKCVRRLVFMNARCFSAAHPPSELELQTRWFAGDFGRRFRSVSGDDVEIIQFGTWNRAAGPDFSDAVVRLNAGEPIRGTIEFDLADRSWETHGHATNPAFDDAVLHVFVHQSDRTFFTRHKSNRNVPQCESTRTSCRIRSPRACPLARPGRCQAPLKDLPEERLCRILAAASQFRCNAKPPGSNIVENHGRDEALFQEIAAALGYKENKLAFLSSLSDCRSVSCATGRRHRGASFRRGGISRNAGPGHLRRRLAVTSENFGTVGGHTAMECIDSSCRRSFGAKRDAPAQSSTAPPRRARHAHRVVAGLYPISDPERAAKPQLKDFFLATPPPILESALHLGSRSSPTRNGAGRAYIAYRRYPGDVIPALVSRARGCVFGRGPLTEKF